MTDMLSAVLDAATAGPERLAITDTHGRGLTHEQLNSKIRSVAAGLLAHGMRPGDQMLFAVRPSPAGICLALGCIAAGGTVLLPRLDRRASGSEVAAAGSVTALPVRSPQTPTWVAADSLLYSAGRSLSRLRLPRYPEPVQHIHSGAWLPGVPRSALSLRRLLSTAPVDAAALPTIDDDLPALGVITVPRPEGPILPPTVISHTRRALASALDVAPHTVALRSDDVVLTDQFRVGLPAIVVGAQWRLPPLGFSPDTADLPALLHQVSVLHAVPKNLTLLAAAATAAQYTPPTLRTVITGGAPVSRSAVRAAKSLVAPEDLIAVYGMSAMLPVARTTGRDILNYDGPGYLAGRLLPGVLARIDDGELLVSGRHLSTLTLNESEHRTGDLAHFHGGQLVLHGRVEEAVRRADTVIHPAMYEPKVSALPGVGDAAVVAASPADSGPAGVPDQPKVVLFVTPAIDPGDPSPEVVLLPGHHLAGMVADLLPSTIEGRQLPDLILVAGSLPRSGRAGHIDRKALRRWASEALAADHQPATQSSTVP